MPFPSCLYLVLVEAQTLKQKVGELLLKMMKKRQPSGDRASESSGYCSNLEGPNTPGQFK